MQKKNRKLEFGVTFSEQVGGEWLLLENISSV
jgi:hypothetical protein